MKSHVSSSDVTQMFVTAAWALPLQTVWRRCLPPLWFILVIIFLTCCYFQANWCLKRQTSPGPRIDLNFHPLISQGIQSGICPVLLLSCQYRYSGWRQYIVHLNESLNHSLFSHTHAKKSKRSLVCSAPWKYFVKTLWTILCYWPESVIAKGALQFKFSTGSHQRQNFPLSRCENASETTFDRQFNRTSVYLRAFSVKADERVLKGQRWPG